MSGSIRTPAPAPPHAVLPVRFINGFDIQTSKSSRLRVAYSWIHIRTEENEQATFASPRDLKEDTPTQQATLWLSKQFGSSFTLDGIVRYVDKLPASNYQQRERPQIDAYTELDLNLTWMVNSSLTLNLVGRDLLNSSHLEFIDSQLPSPAAEIERSWYIKASFRY